MPEQEADATNTMRDLEIFNDIQNFIRRRINNRAGNYIDIWPQRTEVTELIRRSIETKESNSAIICGPSGCGKSALMDYILEDLTKEKVINEESALIIQLSGLMHTDDRIALQDITRQLKISDCIDPTTFSSFQENLVYLLEKLKDPSKGEQPCVIFILDEFHLFCGHKNQILLYNLFDISQSAKAPICVIGLTYYTDVMDLLEKRVLSRFSHRMIWLTHSTTIEDRLKMFKDIFTLNPEDLPHVDEIYKVLWNVRIDELIKNKEVIEVVKKQLDADPSQSKFRNTLLKLFNTITFECPLLTADNIKNVFSPLDFHLLMLSSFCVLEMALLIGIKHQTIMSEKEPFNFEMVYAHYLKFCKKNSTALLTERSVVIKAFQRLQELEIVVPVKKTLGNATGKVPPEYLLYNLNLTEDQILEGVKLNTDLTTEVRQWAFSSF